MSTAALPGAALAATAGAGIYKLGYVTADVDAAVAAMSETYGIDFVRFDPVGDATDANGVTMPTGFRCAFSRGRDLVIELMQPVGGLVDHFAERVPSSGIAFHHVGVLVDDLEATVDALPAPPVLRSRLPHMAVTYSYLPSFDHYIEHVQYFSGGDEFLQSVRAALPT